jgi:hypothetical protein
MLTHALPRAIAAAACATPVFFAFALTACDSNVTPGGPVCSGFEDAEAVPTAAVTWRFVNATNVPLYLQPAEGCSSVEIGYRLTGTDGAVLTPESGPCAGSCEQLQEEGDLACAADCAIPPVRMLPPGTSFEHVWDATHWQQKEMSEECVASPGGFPQSEPLDSGPEMIDCVQRVQAEPGRYELSLTAFTTCTAGTKPCDCEGAPDPDGTCRVADGFSAQLDGTPFNGKVSFSVPTTGVVEMRFEGQP